MRAPLQGVAFQKILKRRTFFHQAVAFAQQFQLFKAAQDAQAHVQNRFRLNIAEFTLACGGERNPLRHRAHVRF